MANDSVFLHVDMDAFYASIEQLDDPALRGRPVIVGGNPNKRGVVAACSYEARVFGVRSAMPMRTAVRLCPDAEIRPPRMRRYHDVSVQIMAILRDYSPEVIAVSIDEAFINLTGTERLLGPPAEVARKLKERVRSSSGLTVSVGVGPSPFIAKLASDVDKPDGLHVVESGQEEAFVSTLALKNLWGLGKQTLRRLENLRITTVDDLRGQSIEFLRAHFGEHGASFLYCVSRGEDPGVLRSARHHHSVSSERTLEEDTSDSEALRLWIIDLAQEVVFRSRDEQWNGPTVQIKYRYSDFSTFTARKTLDHPVSDAVELSTVAFDLFADRWSGEPIRLIGVGIAGASEFEEEGQQQLFGDDRNKRLDDAIYGLKKRFSGVPIQRASLIGRNRPTGPTKQLGGE